MTRCLLVLLLSACTTTPAPRRVVEGPPLVPPPPSFVGSDAGASTPLIPTATRDAVGCIRRDDGGWSARCSACAQSDADDDAGCDQVDLQCNYNTNVCFATDGCVCDGKHWRCGVQSCP